MAHNVEPMDIDSDFDNKENSLHHNNVLPFTEKGYEELDVSELNMKLRYSITPASSPMSKSYTANCLDNRSLESGDDLSNVTVNENSNLTRSLNSTLTKNDNVLKSLKALPLQALPTEHFVENNRSTSVLRPLDSTVTQDNANVTVTVSGPNDIDENLSLLSSSSSAVQTPEATTPTKDIPKHEAGSPIMRGLKSVLNMFRSSQSPIPPTESEDNLKPEMLSPAGPAEPPAEEAKSQAMLASTPIAAHRKKEVSPTKRSSPHKDSLVFNEDLEKELLWKDETTILFSQERIPIHKLFFQQPRNEDRNTNGNEQPKLDIQDDLNSTVEYMDISYNDSIRDRTMTDIQVIGNRSECTIAGESDGEFVDCETTFTKNESLIEDKDKTPVIDNTINLDKDTETTNENTSASRLKQIILNTTQDILDATLSITPEDLLPDALEKSKVVSEQVSISENTEIKVNSENGPEKNNVTIDTVISIVNEDNSSLQATEQSKLLTLNETIDIASQSVVGQQVEDPNVTKTICNQTVHINNYLTNEEYKEDSVSHTKEDILPETVSSGIQGDFVERLDSTSSTETLVQDDEIIEHCGFNATHSIEDCLLKTVENTLPTISTPRVIEETINNPQPPTPDNEVNVSLKEASMTELPADIPLPDEDDLEKELTIPADSTTEAYKVPFSLPLDLVDDFKVKSEIKHLDGAKNKLENDEKPDCKLVLPEVLSPLSNTNFEGGDYIQSQTISLDAEHIDAVQKLADADVNKENILFPVDVLPADSQIAICETASTVATVDVFPEVAPIENVDVFPEVTPIVNVDVQPEEPQILNVDVSLPEVPQLVTDDVLPKETQVVTVDVLSQELHIGNLDEPEVPHIVTTNVSEEPQIATNDVLPNGPQIVNVGVLTEEPQVVVSNETQNKTDKVPHDMDLNASITCDIGENAIQAAVVAPININESIIELKPLPDIINQTIAMPNIEIKECDTKNSESEIQEHTVPLTLNLENTTDEVIHPEIVSEAMNNVVPELLSDSNVTEIDSSASDITDVSKLPITPDLEEIIKNPVNNVTETMTVEGSTAIIEMISNDQKNNADIIPTNTSVTKNEVQALDSCSVSVNENIKTKDEEIVLSENNSPFVSVTADDIPEMTPVQSCDVQNFNDQSESAGKVVCTAPASPPITSKGYNFNFDEMDDPFATKTKIRLSPPLDTPNKAGEPEVISRSVEKPIPKKEMNNRRKTQSERKRPVASKRKFNSTFNSNVSSEKTLEKTVEKFAAGDINLELPTNVVLDPKNVTIEEDKLIHEASIVNEKTMDVAKQVLKSRQQADIKLENNIEQPVEVIDTLDSDAIQSNKTTSSSEQSTYYSAGTSSSESVLSRNVFNLPEIDDMNFNPFATKSKMRESPPPSLDMENPFVTKSKIRNTPESSMIIPENYKDITKTLSPDDKMETELMEKDASDNLSYTTNSSKATDEKNATIREINTEDEDTIEGPFLEAEDLNIDDKMSDFDGEHIDMMQFGDLPTRGNEDNQDNGELFIDAEAFEFLLNQNKCNTVVDSGKESLFLKFDPLFAKRMSSVTSDSVVASLNKLQKRQSTPTTTPVKTTQKEVMSPIAGPSNLNATIDMNVSEEFNDDLNVTVSKPMMVVPPAVNPVTPRNKSLTPNRPNRRSITFTSPAMAVIDRLLSLSGNTSLVHDTTVTQATREQNEADLALTQLRELLAEKEIHVYTLRSESNELKDRLTTLESHLKSLETESQERLKKINNLNDRLAEKTKINKSMAAVVEEYERTIASLISETAQDKKRHAEERIKLINERDEQTAHLASMEVSFSDLHSKYEKSKQVILNCKANEDAYKKSIKEFEENLKKMQNNYELLKQHATSKLNHANQELEKMNKTHEAEVLKLNAMIKRKELHITSLEESLAQKTKANEELTAICDELINKVG